MLPKDRPLLVYCAGGYRSSIAASLLQRRGFRARQRNCRRHRRLGSRETTSADYQSLVVEANSVNRSCPFTPFGRLQNLWRRFG